MIIITDDQCTIAGSGLSVLTEITTAIYRFVEISVKEGFPKEEVEKLVRNSVEIAFMTEEEMDQRLAELDKIAKEKRRKK